MHLELPWMHTSPQKLTPPSPGLSVARFHEEGARRSSGEPPTAETLETLAEHPRSFSAAEEGTSGRGAVR